MTTDNPYATGMAKAEKAHAEKLAADAAADGAAKEKRNQSLTAVQDFIRDTVSPELAQAREYLVGKGYDLQVDQTGGTVLPGNIRFFLTKGAMQVSDVYGISLTSKPQLYRIDDRTKLDHLNTNPFYKTPPARKPITQDLTPLFDIPNEWNTILIRDYVMAVVTDLLAPKSEESISSRFQRSMS